MQNIWFSFYICQIIIPFRNERYVWKDTNKRTVYSIFTYLKGYLFSLKYKIQTYWTKWQIVKYFYSMKERISKKNPFISFEEKRIYFQLIWLCGFNVKEFFFNLEMFEVHRMLDKSNHFYTIFKRIFAGILTAMLEFFFDFL